MNFKSPLAKLFLLLSLCHFITACGAKLKDDPLNIGVLDEEYYEALSFSDNSGAFNNNDYIFSLESGDLPLGLTLNSDGEITGVPISLGLYAFVVKLYSIDDGYYSDDSVATDTDNLEIFITEANTNEDCPAPNDDTTTETYICAGSGFLESLAEGESFDLDINYFVDFENSFEYEINRLSFTITYDDTYFELNENELNSQILREASDGVDATVSFNNDTAGALKITLTTDDDESFRFSGRLLDVPFYAKSDVPAGEYDFTVAITNVTSNEDDVDLPENINIDGTVTVEFDLVAEE